MEYDNFAAMRETCIKNEIENFLKRDHVFDCILRKNPNLFSEKLATIVYKSFWFEYNECDIVFFGEPIIDETVNDNGDFFIK